MSTPESESSGPLGGELELNAETAAEFMAMMRAMQVRSGRTPGQVVAFSKIPRSTVYRYLHEETTALPEKRERVEAFARACRLNTIQVNRVLWLWDNLTSESADLSGDHAADADLEVPNDHREPGGAGEARSMVVVNGNYNVYHSRVPAPPDDGDADHDTADDDEPAGADTDGWGHYARNGGGGPRGPRDGGHQRAASELVQFLLTVLGDRELFVRTLVLIVVMFLGTIAVAVTLHLLGVSGTSLAMTMLGILGIVSSGIAGGLVRRRRR